MSLGYFFSKLRGSGVSQNKEVLTAQVRKVAWPQPGSWDRMDDSFCEHSETLCLGSRDGQVNQELPLAKEKY